MWTATPSANNLFVGKGVAYFDRYDANGASTGSFHFGNVTSIAPTTDDNILTKYSSMSHDAPVYKRIMSRRTQTVKVNLDEVVPRNLALGVMGQAANLVQAGTPVTAEPVNAATVPGSYYKTKLHGPISAVTVHFGATPGVLNTDYRIVDANIGIIQILSGTILTGAVTIDYTPTAYAGTAGPDIIHAGSSSFIEGSMLVVGDPTSGPAMMLQFWHVSIEPDSAFDFIGEDFGSIQLTMTVLDDSVNHPSPDNLWRITYI